MKKAAIATADAVLASADLPVYAELATLLRAADNKLAAIAAYHAGPAKLAIEELRGKLHSALDKIPE